MCKIIYFNDTAPTEIYTLSLHDALPISVVRPLRRLVAVRERRVDGRDEEHEPAQELAAVYPTFTDRKSTRLNSSHMSISYAVFCLKKKTTKYNCSYYLRQIAFKTYI